MDAEVAVLGKVLSEQPVHVLVGSPLPWFPGVSEEDPVAEEGGDLVVARHLGTLVPGQRAPQVRAVETLLSSAPR